MLERPLEIGPLALQVRQSTAYVLRTPPSPPPRHPWVTTTASPLPYTSIRWSCTYAIARGSRLRNNPYNGGIESGADSVRVEETWTRGLRTKLHMSLWRFMGDGARGRRVPRYRVRVASRRRVGGSRVWACVHLYKTNTNE